MTDLYLPRPTTGDVVDLILDDHRLFEDLLRQLRDATADREAARSALAAVLVAHGEAEEAKVYPSLVRKDAIEAARGRARRAGARRGQRRPCWRCWSAGARTRRSSTTPSRSWPPR